MNAAWPKGAEDDGVLFRSDSLGTGHDPSRLFIGYTLGGVLMIVGGVVELLLGVAAEGKELEQVARPLTAVPASQVPRAPMPRGQYLPHTTPPSQVSVGA